MTAPAPHYFQFSWDFDGNGRRLCADCRRPYDDGEHIEITTLKPYTAYVCPKGGGLGHSSRWTGAYRPDGRTTRDHFCICGAELVEEDDERWQLSWEMQTPLSDGQWVPQVVVRSRHAAQAQRDGLLQLAHNGEPIRNVILQDVAAAAGNPGLIGDSLIAERDELLELVRAVVEGVVLVTSDADSTRLHVRLPKGVFPRLGHAARLITSAASS